MNEEQFNAPSSCVECRTLYAFWLIQASIPLPSIHFFFLLAITCASDGCDIYVDGLRIHIRGIFYLSGENFYDDIDVNLSDVFLDVIL